MIADDDYRAMRRYAQKLVRGSLLEADDVTQEAAMYAVKSWHTFVGTSRLAWLLSITHNTAGMMRLAASRKKRGGGARPVELGDWHAAGDMRRDVERLQHHDQLRHGMEQLTERQAEILWHRYQLGQSWTEAARALGVANGTSVRKVEERALEALRQTVR